MQAAWFAANQAYLEYLKRLRDFEKIKGRVEVTFKQLNDWIVNNLVKAKEKAMETLRDGALKSLILNSSKYGITDPELLGNKFTPLEAYSWGVGEYESEDGCDGFREGV